MGLRDDILGQTEPGDKALTPPRTAIPQSHDVRICKTENGFILYIGCKTFVAKEWPEVFLCLGEYWVDPVAAQNKYCGQS
ncbi:MAG: hypothetical protein AAB922_04780 [Patescibacteria group bacterium]